MMYKIYYVSGMHVHGIQVNWCLYVLLILNVRYFSLWIMKKFQNKKK